MGNCLSVFGYRYVMLGAERIKLGEKMGQEKSIRAQVENRGESRKRAAFAGSLVGRTSNHSDLLAMTYSGYEHSNLLSFHSIQQDPKHGLSRSIPPLGVVGLSRSTVIAIFVIERSLVRFWERRYFLPFLSQILS
jgi:hypothetical protein